MVCPYISCLDCSISHSNSTCAGPYLMVGHGGRSRVQQPNAGSTRARFALRWYPCASCTVWWWWCLWLYFLCVGGCVYVVVVAVHGGFAAVTQPRIHLEERSPQECIATVLRTDSCCPMYCARIRLLSLA